MTVSWTTFTDPIVGVRPRDGDTARATTREQPYTQMSGGVAGAVSADGLADSVKVFPVQTFASSQYPAAYDTAKESLDPNEFLKWHSTFQVEYIKKNGTSFTEADGTSKAGWLTLGPVEGRSISVFLAAQSYSGSEASLFGEKIHVVEDLTANAVALMSKETQIRLAQIPAWFTKTTGMATKLGYLPVSTATSLGRADVDTTRDVLIARVDDEYIAKITAFAAITDTAGTTRPSEDVKSLFKQQLENVKTRLNANGVFNEQAMIDACEAIKLRFDRICAFAVGKTTEVISKTKSIYIDDDVDATVTVNTVPSRLLNKNVVSLDDNATIISGYDIFVKKENQLLLVDNLKIYLGNASGVRSRAIDVPRIIFLLQMAYNLQKETVSDQNTEEIQQQNRYMQDISYMKQMIQTTRAMFGTKSDERISLLGMGQDDLFKFSEKERLAISMWSDQVDRIKHPIETLRSLGDRPTLDMLHTGMDFSSADGVTGNPTGYSNTYFNDYIYIRRDSTDRLYYMFTTSKTLLSNTWDQYTQKISDRTSIIQQDSQLVQNKINSTDKEKTRHFELANNAVSKMFDTLQNILRAG